MTCELTLPAEARAIIIFSQAGCSRKSARSRLMADYLHQRGFGTILPDLLMPEEEEVSGKQYDVELLGGRLAVVTQWVIDRDLSHCYRLGFYGTSAGAAVALRTAVLYPEHIGAIVCRGGRPDLAKNALARVKAPTLLIVGSLDKYVLQLNREALDEMACAKQLEVVMGVSHLFEGKADEVAASVTAWFERHLRALKVVNH